MTKGDALDDLLAAAAAKPPAPSADVMARLESQALQNLPMPDAPAPRVAAATAPFPAPKAGF